MENATILHAKREIQGGGGPYINTSAQGQHNLNTGMNHGF